MTNGTRRRTSHLDNDPMQLLGRLDARVGNIEGAVDEIKKLVETLDKTMRGYNDHPGVIARLASIEKVTRECPIADIAKIAINNQLILTTHLQRTETTRQRWTRVGGEVAKQTLAIMGAIVLAYLLLQLGLK